tara:strand:+ start:1887 stop:2777 length:891 start_codon:yes stop_codon:yes gene_type:complete
MFTASSTKSRHIPVMLMESLENLKIKKDGIYVDGTLGLGGHSECILKKINSGLLIGIDRDKNSISLAKKQLSTHKNIKVFNDSYKNLKDILESLNIVAVDGILLDLGLSSFQLEDNSRGFSHKYESSLDMRFDCNSQDYTAEQIIQKNDLNELTKIFKEFGEERHAYKIAKKIKDLKGEINVMSITSIVDRVTPYKFRLKTYSRIFQALRIAANDELSHLNEFLDNFINLLNPGGRVVIISYHSVEDRIVKHKLKDLKNEKKIELIFKKPIAPSNEEVSINKRARSAKMRVGEKIG